MIFAKFVDFYVISFNFNRKMYHDYICQYENVLKQYQLKYSETRFSCKYYEKKKEHEEIQNRVLACTEQLKKNETILMELLGIDILLYTALVTACVQWKEYNHSQLKICFTVPAPFPSLTKWTVYMYPQQISLIILLDKYNFCF